MKRFLKLALPAKLQNNNAVSNSIHKFTLLLQVTKQRKGSLSPSIPAQPIDQNIVSPTRGPYSILNHLLK
uniref:Uncharacterized protein n=1 Tax=Rhizophora mucronata TaxID=61149 RepID=A0A2P2JEV1_RHIMU